VTKIGEKIGDEGHLGGDLGEDGGGSEVVLQLGAVDAPDSHCHVDDVDHQTHGYNQEHHNCDENPPSLMASSNRRAVSCAGVEMRSSCSLCTCTPRVASLSFHIQIFLQIFHCEKHPLDFYPIRYFLWIL